MNAAGHIQEISFVDSKFNVLNEIKFSADSDFKTSLIEIYDCHDLNDFGTTDSLNVLIGSLGKSQFKYSLKHVIIWVSRQTQKKTAEIISKRMW
eukprot:CAMPEP_0168324064 /NCGR_PEP_ID=MMETSP0213-20121227/3857_1 /TAXON_ID=151035 /ORGANISM="Euplotes harpa, Strain FSP1.4" /LENGTH=93 /DNA_ID=CAMNT_0008326261 /DNA_START=525 /DNA_END=803 /DNA_ORIENTATION=+